MTFYAYMIQTNAC